MTSLGDVCEIVMGQAPEGTAYNEAGNGWPLIAGAGDFKAGRLVAKKFTTSAPKLTRLDDIVLSIRASIGAKVWADGEYCLGRGVAALRPDSTLDRRYLWHWLSYHEVDLQSRGRGATFLQVSKVDIAGMPIFLPPLAEQRRIASILDRVDKLRATRRRAVALTRDFVDGAFASIFGDVRANSRGWRTVAFVDAAENQDSRRVPIEASIRIGRQGPFAYYGASGVIDSIDDFIFEGERLLIGEDGANLVARSSPVAFLASGRFWVNNHAHVLSSSVPGRLRYLEHFLARTDLSPYITGSAQPKLNRSNLDRIPVPLPPDAKQWEFEVLASQVDDLRRRQQAHQAQLDELFASLQHRAFRGEL